jgi:hypothetical protein
MFREGRMFRVWAAWIVLLPLSAVALAQGTIQQQELPPLPAAPQSQAPSPPPQSPMLHLQRDPIAAGPAAGAAAVPPPAATPSPAAGPESGRVFCEQSVSYRLAAPDSVPEPYRAFIGIFSDASWTPQLCAALVVQNVQPDGTASIVYAYGPMGTNVRGGGGVLNGTGMVRDGELRFQNTDGSQFAFKPLYSDLDGRLTMPKGQSYEAVFKRTF